MREGTRLWKDTIKQVLRLLNELDPYGLEPGLPDGAPADEYDMEAAPIALRLMKDGAITAEQVDAIWLKWFDEPLTEAIGAEPTAQFVTNLNALAAPKKALGDTAEMRPDH